MKTPCPRIEGVLPQSIGEKFNIKPGEILRSINGKILRDIIDYQYLTADESIVLEIENHEGKTREVKILKEFDDDLGIVFENAVFDGIYSCKNKCIFCFVDQMPKGYRKTLYVKDDDYRLSFLYGNYITLTNLKEEDLQRIEEEHLSPLYVSIHCIDKAMRQTVLGIEEKTPFMDILNRLVAAGISMHGQIVLAPGYNDGRYLEETIKSIASLDDAFLSLALVPVGLTKCQKNKLDIYKKEEAKAIIKFAEDWQTKFLKEKETRFLFPSDEFYLLAEKEIPSEEAYEDYPQIENGVGIIRQFYEDFDYAIEDYNFIKNSNKKAILITGVHGGKVLTPKMKELKQKGVNAELLIVKNDFFGETVTVTGLLTGEDIIKAINNHNQKEAIYLLPDVLLKHHTDVLLDGVSVNDLENNTGATVWVVPSDANSLLDVLLNIGKDIIL